MSRTKRMKSVREAKDRRAKRIAIGGGVLLAVLLAWEIPHYLGGHKSSTPPPATTTAATTTPGATTTPTTAPTTTPGVTPATATGTPTATGSTKLPNSDTPPSYDKGQLAGFSTFASKDPFIQQVVAGATGQLTASTSSSGSTSAPASSSQSANSRHPIVRTLAQTGAVTISVNGKRESVRVGASFPAANPVFRLVSLSGGAARIGIANGSYTSGAQTVLLRLNRTLTLVDTANGIHYKLQLLQGS